MALYRYVSGKAQLLAVTIEAAVGEPPVLTGTGWRSRIEEWAGLLRDNRLRHPWLPQATVGYRAMGPREVAWIECPVAALAEAGFSAVLAAARSGRSADNGWRFGLELILDGLEARVAGARR